MNYCVKSSGGVKGGDIFFVGGVMFGEGVLGCEFEFDFVGEVYFFKCFVFVNVWGDYFFDLFCFEEFVEIWGVGVGIVGDGGEVGEVGVVVDFVDEGVGDVVEVEVVVEEGWVGFYVFDCFGGWGVDFVDFVVVGGEGEGVGEEGVVLGGFVWVIWVMSYFILLFMFWLYLV